MEDRLLYLQFFTHPFYVNLEYVLVFESHTYNQIRRTIIIIIYKNII